MSLTPAVAQTLRQALAAAVAVPVVPFRADMLDALRANDFGAAARSPASSAIGA